MSLWYTRTGLASLAARSELLFANLDRRDATLAIPDAAGEIDDVSDTVLFANARVD
jgi:hypothetical protein